MNSNPKLSAQGVSAAFLTPIFLGVAPIFGKLAIEAGADPFTVAAFRTAVAVAILWIFYAAFFRSYVYIYPAGLLGCVVIGVVNGIGSLFYYSGLNLLDASLVQLLNGMYIAFAVLLIRIGGERINGRVLMRVLLAVLALVILTGFGSEPINWLGVGLMLGSALMFAGTVSLSQYLLYEMPPQTVTLYVLSTMAVVVAMVWAAAGNPVAFSALRPALWPIVVLGVTTALSRLAMFAGVRFLGSLQTAALAITEIGVALTLAFIVLGERLSALQWIGVAILGASMLLVRTSDLKPINFNPGRFLVANMASIQFQRIAFHRAFGKPELDNADHAMAKLTTREMRAIQDMMGVADGPVDPYPIQKEVGYSVDLQTFLTAIDGDSNVEDSGIWKIKPRDDESSNDD